MRVAEALVDRLTGYGVQYFFMLTGGDQPLWIALHDAGIKMVVARSEFSAVYMADGYARASKKPGIAYGQAGPGAANVASALADPFWAQSPVFALTGANSTKTNYLGEYQSLDQMPMFAPVTKWSGYAANAAKVPQLVSLAISQSLSGSQGPTHLDVPKDFFGLEIEYQAGSASSVSAVAAIPPEAGSLDRACQAMMAAKRPVILAGDGAVQARAGEELVKLAETLGVPVATTMGGKTAIPSDHSLNIGVVGRYSSIAANELVAQSDCVLVVGSRLGGLATRGYSIPDQNARIISINTDPDAFDVSYSMEIKLLSDAKLTLEAMASELSGRRLSGPAQEWVRGAKRRVEEWRSEVTRATRDASDQEYLSPFQVIDAMSPYNREITLVADTGYMAAWTGVLFPTVTADSFFRAIGSLGWAFPASLGVQLARKEKVVCVTGDGGIGYHLADIETAVRHRIPVIVVVLNNNGLVFEYHEQKYRHDGNVVPEANDLTEVDYSAAAQALGAQASRVNTREEFEVAFKRALDHEGPTVLDVVVDREAFPPVTNFERAMQRKI